RAGGRLRYRRSRCLRSARACAGATARRTRVSGALVPAQETGRLLRVRADLVARTVPWITSLYLLARAAPFVKCPAGALPSVDLAGSQPVFPLRCEPIDFARSVLVLAQQLQNLR